MSDVHQIVALNAPTTKNAPVIWLAQMNDVSIHVQDHVDKMQSVKSFSTTRSARASKDTKAIHSAHANQFNQSWFQNQLFHHANHLPVDLMLSVGKEMVPELATATKDLRAMPMILNAVADENAKSTMIVNWFKLVFDSSVSIHAKTVAECLPNVVSKIIFQSVPAHQV